MAPMTIEIENLRHGYRAIIDPVLLHGEVTAPRGRKTREVLNPTIVLYDPADSLPIGVSRNLSLRVAAVEAVQLCGAFSDPDLVVAASPNFEKYREADGTFHGAYGRRIGTQLKEAVKKLDADPASRQAVITLWSPSLDNVPNRLDYPCTLGFQFYVRNDRLCMTSMMRSNDVWLGLAYDLFQFSQLQWTAANLLRLEAGPLTHRVTSLHLYDDDVEKAGDVAWQPTVESLNLRGFGSVERAFSVGNGFLPSDASETETWFHGVIRPMIDGGLRDRD